MPRYSEKVIEEIKEKIRLSSLISERTEVIRKGGRLWAKCPFHGGGNERTPSFTFDDESGRYHCFGCGESGNIFSFVEKTEHITFPEAVRFLASKAGIALEEENAESRRKRDEKESLKDLYKRLTKTFRYFLTDDKMGEKARIYLLKRGVSEEMSERFLLGYAPSGRDFLYSFLKKKGYSDELLKKSGLFSQNHFPYPLFQDRIMFPIRNIRGEVVAFSGRDLSRRDDTPKYINSPETILYSKKATLFGMYESLDGLKKKDGEAIMIEGNFDVIAMHQAGYDTAMAPLGTSFTEEQANLILRYTNKISLLFDSDEAGEKSTGKAMMMLIGKNFDVSIHHLLSYKDASETLEKLGKEGLEKEFSDSKSPYMYLVEKGLKRYDIKMPRGKSDFLKSLIPFLSATTSSVERDGYIQDIALRLGVSEEDVRNDIRKGSTPERSERRKEEDYENAGSGNRFNSAKISMDLYGMLILAGHRNLFPSYRRKLRFSDLKDDDAKVIYTVLENAMREEVESDEVFLSLIDDDRLRNYVSTSFLLDEFKDGAVNVLDEIVDRITLRSLEGSRKLLNSQILLLSDSTSENELRELVEKKKELDTQINAFRNRLFRNEENI